MLPVRGNTIILLIIAVIFGSLAVLAANFWLRVQTPQISEKPAPAKVETSTIVVASRDLKFGEPLTEDFLREIPWPRDSVPEGAFAKIADINKEGRRVVLTAIGPNEPVLAWKISGPGARATLSALVTDGMRAVAVRVNDTSGVAGFILPGDRVDVLYTKEGGEAGNAIDILLQNVRVLALNQVADEKKSDPIIAKVATLELTPLDAQKVSLAQSTGGLTLTLRAAGSLDQAPAQRIVEAELVSNPSVYQSAFNAQAEAQAKLDARLKGLEGSLTKVESTLLGKIESAGASSAELKAKLATLEAQVQATAKATGEGEVELRGKLAALEAAIRQAGAAGQGEEALRAKLAEFEASLRQMMAQPGAPTPEVIAEVAPPVNVNVRIFRGLDNATYTVPLDLVRQ